MQAQAQAQAPVFQCCSNVEHSKLPRHTDWRCVHVPAGYTDYPKGTVVHIPGAPKRLTVSHYNVVSKEHYFREIPGGYPATKHWKIISKPVIKQSIPFPIGTAHSIAVTGSVLPPIPVTGSVLPPIPVAARVVPPIPVPSTVLLPQPAAPAVAPVTFTEPAGVHRRGTKRTRGHVEPTGIGSLRSFTCTDRALIESLNSECFGDATYVDGIFKAVGVGKFEGVCLCVCVCVCVRARPCRQV